MSCLLFDYEEGRKGKCLGSRVRRGKCFDGLKDFGVDFAVQTSAEWEKMLLESFSNPWRRLEVHWKSTILRNEDLKRTLNEPFFSFSFTASIFPSSLGYSNWGSPTNLYPPHSMSHVTSSHVSPHLGSYSHHYAWPSHTPAANHQVDNFELYKKLSPYE